MTVARNDEIDLEGIEALHPDGIVISPGPSRPENAGISLAIIRHFGPVTPILGVCLGHQAIGLAYGGEVITVEPVHGKRSAVDHRGVGCFSGLATPMQAGRYHSLAVARETLPAVAGGDGHLSRRPDHGPSAPRAPGRRHPVPPRIHPDQ